MMWGTVEQIFKFLTYILIPSDLLVRTALFLMAVYWLQSLFRLGRAPEIPEVRVVSNVKPQEHQKPPHNQEEAIWEKHYEKKVLDELSLIADIHQSDWRAVIERNHAIVLRSVDRFRTAPNIILLLGLMTTIIGLAGAVSRLGPSLVTALSSGELSLMKQQLAEAFSQLGAAFSGTLWGILLALHLTSAYAKRREGVLTRLQTADSSLLSRLKDVMPPNPGAYLKELNDVAGQIKNVVSDLKMIIDKFGPTMNEASNKFKQALDDSGKVIEKSLVTLKEEAAKIEQTLNDAANTLTGAVKAVTEVTSAISTAVTNLGHAHKELLTAVDSQFTMWHNHLEIVLGKTNTLQDTFQKKSLEIVDKITTLNDKVAYSVAQMREVEERFEAAKLELVSLLKKHYGDAADKVTTAVDSGMTNINEIKSAFESLVQGSLDQIASIQDTFNSLASEVTKIVSDINSASSSVETAMGGVSEGSRNLKAILTELNGQLKNFAAESKRLWEHASNYRSSIESLSQAANLLHETVPKFTHTIELLSASAKRNGSANGRERTRVLTSRSPARRLACRRKRGSKADFEHMEATSNET